MEGRRTFSRSEIKELRSLLRAKEVADDDDERRRIRRKLRSMGFYISDFSEGPDPYTAYDFDVDIKQGLIDVITDDTT